MGIRGATSKEPGHLGGAHSSTFFFTKNRPESVDLVCNNTNHIRTFTLDSRTSVGHKHIILKSTKNGVKSVYVFLPKVFVNIIHSIALSCCRKLLSEITNKKKIPTEPHTSI